MTWVLITGATGGIGKHAAVRLAAAGLRVIATGRSPDKLAALERAAAVRTVLLDVRDAESVERAAARAHELTGGYGVDVLVNNAGYGEMGPLEAFDPDRVRAVFETNVVGVARVTRAFVPAMRSRGRGRVINVSSVLGRTTIPLHGPYAATKHALEAMSDALRQEMAPFGVSVTVIEPGSIATGFDELAFAGLTAIDDPTWGPIAEGARKLEAVNQRASAKPEVVSEAILAAATSPAPPTRVVVPRAAGAQLAAARVAPRGIYEGLMRRAMGLPRRERANRSQGGLALVTGAGGGIGSATAVRLARHGFSVLATDVDPSALARVTRDATERRLAIDARPMDVTDSASVRRVADHVARISDGRGLAVLVNNAGYAELGPIELAGDDAWRSQLEVNVHGLLAVTRAFAPAMRRAGSGCIVNVSSVAGILAFPFMGVYCASKFAVEALTDVMRLELGAFGVDVGAVQPAFIRTGFAERAQRTIERYRLAAGPYAPMAERIDAILARMDAVGGEPADVARAIVRAVTRPRARYQAPFSAALAARVLPWTPTALEDRALAAMFETHRLGASGSSTG